MITDLRLQQFRSYADASFEVGPGVNIIVGPNASGKTNLLEAVLVLAGGKSYRAKDAELVQFGAPWARLDADTEDSTHRTVKLQVGEPTQKNFEIDGQNFTRISRARMLPAVLFEPNHLLMLSSSPELRRTFLDDLIEQSLVGYGATRRHYKRVVAQRNNLLKKNPPGLREQLFVWNLRLSELGGKIARERQALVERFHQEISGLYSSLAAHDNAVDVSYATTFPIETYESALLKKLESSTELDVLRGFTAYGPHRDDLLVKINDRPVQEAASRGEARTMVLALKLLELYMLEEIRGIKPLLLLDDVFSELDGKRRRALTGYVANYQTFITTTDADMVLEHFASSNVIPVGAGKLAEEDLA